MDAALIEQPDGVDWVARLRSAGISVDEDPAVATWAEQSGGAIFACILAGPRSRGHVFSVALLPGLTDAEASQICHEAMIRFDRLAKHGYEPDGWQRRSDGDYQLWLRLHDFGPDFPFN